ncbi:MAG: formyltransferase family protein [Trichlorobacter sp.]|uniref:formyltransferase family protein n=1 Tax=Trichlorobacter sp. TaxID=2911007 RepID=UPI0025674F5A|nr:formyltransferase family protein [Trichlorobacter sp.]MDK9719188.1 formyltransferase family protein [Trichlorobacter sp.]
MINRPAHHSPLRVVFCTTPSVYSDVVLQELLRSSSIELVGIVASTRILSKKRWMWWDAARLVRKTGLRYAAYLWVVTTVYCLARRLLVRDDPVRCYLYENRVPVYTSRDINSGEGIAFVKSLQPDLLLSAHFNQLIGPELLALPVQGCLNIHPGALPEYKGVDPVIRAVDNGEKQAGVTLHRQDAGFDTGTVLATAELAISGGDTLFSLNMRLFLLGTELLLELLSRGGDVPAGALQQPDQRYDSWPDAALVARLRRSGRRLIGVRSFWTCLRGALE